MRINKDQLIISKRKNLKFSYLRGKGHLLAFLLNRLGWHYYPRLHYVSKFPCHLDIETSATCNMKCPMCFTVSDQFRKKIDKGLMDESLFKKVIDEATKYNMYSIRISHRGEPFVHPKIIDFIRYSKQAGVTEVSSLSNILALTPSLFEKAMKAGLDWLTISFDGLGATYENIRKPAKYEESLERLKEYKKIKKRARSIKPVIKIQSIWPAIKDCANQWVDLLDPISDNLASNPIIDYLHNDDPGSIEFWGNFDCPTPYQRLTVLFNGAVPYCHNDEFETYIIGNVKEDSIYDLWRGKQMTSVREIHRKHEGTKFLSACKHCFLPRKTEPIIENIGDRQVIIDKYIGRTEQIGK